MALNTAEQIMRRREEIPPTLQATYDKAMRGRSPKAAIRAFCAECCGWVRKEVELCSSPECPLFPYRPFQEIPWKAFKSSAQGNLAALQSYRKSQTRAKAKTITPEPLFSQGAAK